MYDPLTNYAYSLAEVLYDGDINLVECLEKVALKKSANKDVFNSISKSLEKG